jgi:pimeloyl-ACP methyl ester carboxylesterase
VPDETLVSPEAWHHDHALLSRPGNDEVQLKLFRDYASNSPMYPSVHEYFRSSRVPLLAVWGRGDEIFGPAGAEAFADDLPDAEIHLLDGGHFLLESALDEVAGLIRAFLTKVHSAA